MPPTDPATAHASSLRQRAEDQNAARSSEDGAALSHVDFQRALHELRVHQIEIEMQNEELRSAQIELDAVRARYFDLYDLAPTGYCTVSKDELIQEANLTAATMLGVARGELVGKPITWFIVKDDRDIYYFHRKKLLEIGTSQICSLRLVKQDGTRFWAHLTATSVHEADGVSACRVVIADIGDLKRTEEELELLLRRRQEINLLQHSLLAPALFEDKIGRITDAIVRIFNADFCRIWTIRPGDLCNQGCVHAEAKDGPHVCRDRRRCLHLLASSGRYTHTDGKGHRRVPFGCYKIGRVASGEDHKFITNDAQNDPLVHDRAWARELGLVSFAGYQLRVPDGQTTGVLALFAKHAIMPAEDQMLDGLSNTAARVIEQAATENKLCESGERHRTILRLAMDGILRADQHGNLLEVNDAFCQMTGYGEQELLAMKLSDLEVIEAETAIAIHIRAVVAEGQERFESRYRRKDGSIIDVEVAAQRDIAEDGNVLAFIRDITGRKQAEVEKAKLEAQVSQVQKMGSLGRLASGVAHDFANILTSTMGHAYLCQIGLPPEHPVMPNLAQIQDDAKRSVRIIRQLLTFAKKQPVIFKTFNINDAVADMLNLLQRLIGEDIELVWQPGRYLWQVKMDLSHIDQILANLAVNARDAIAGVGMIVIETRNAVLDAAACAENNGALPGDYIMLKVTDNGCGMDLATQRQIFEPFFTTKDADHGTGIGLATVFSIVTQSRGIVNVTSEPGKGASFTIYLPRCEGPVGTEQTSASSKEVPRGSETILLVEDDVPLRSACHMFLAGLGYKILAAEGTEHAKLLAAEHAGDIHLLLSDIVMPGTDGCTLARQFMASQPRLRCILMSGHATDVSSLGGRCSFLAKPFLLEELARAVRCMLDGEV